MLHAMEETAALTAVFTETAAATHVQQCRG
jgi:hypothetical protein